MMSVFAEFAITLGLALGAGVATYVALAGSSQSRIQAPLRAFLARGSDRVFYFVVATYVLILSTLLVLRYNAMSDSIDLAQYDQLVWNSLRGRLLENTFVPDAPLFLGKSFVPILLAFVPLYALWSNPLVLSLAQPIAFAAGAFPIYWFARKEIGRALALGIAVSYLLFPIVVNSILLEFHEIGLAAPLLAYAVFFCLRRRYAACFAVLAVALLVKEELAFVVAGFGIFIFLFQKQRWLGLAVVFLGLIWGVALLQFIIPSFQGATSTGFYYFSGGSIAGGAARYGYLGTSLREILTTLFMRPEIVWSHVVTPEKIAFVLHLLVPLAFLPLVGAEIAFLSLPTLGYTLLSTYREQFSVQTSYADPLVPFLFFAASLGLARLIRRIPTPRDHFIAPRGALLAMLLVASSASYTFHSYGPFARWFQSDAYVSNAHGALGKTLIATIPEDAVTVAQDEFLTHLSQRQFLYQIPLIPNYRQADYLFADRSRSWFKVHPDFWEMFLRQGYFEIISEQDSYLFARRKPVGSSSPIRFGNQMTLLGYSMVPSGPISGAMTLQPLVEWRAENNIAQKYKVLAQLVDNAGHVWATDEQEPQGGTFPTNQWKRGKTIGDQYVLKLPPTIPAGEYQINLSVYLSDENGNKYLPANDAAGNLLGSDVNLVTVPIAKNKLSFTASQIDVQQPLIVDMGEMRLLGFVPPRETIAPGELLQVGLYWRARAKPRGDYLVVVQLRDANNRVAFEQSARPAAGSYPTTLWSEGEVLLDWHDIQLPKDILRGQYRIVVQLRNTDTNGVVGETLISTVSVVE